MSTGWRTTEYVLSYPLTNDDNRAKAFDLSAGSIFLLFSYYKHAIQKNPFIWGIQFVKSSFKNTIKIKLKINGYYGVDKKREFSSNAWLNPDKDETGEFLEMEFSPSDMDEGGCVYFTKQSDPSKVTPKTMDMLFMLSISDFGILCDKTIFTRSLWSVDWYHV